MILKRWLVVSLAAVVLITLTVSALAATARLQYVVDGDTVRLRSDTCVRFIGLDAPESDECGGAASEKTINRLVEGVIRLVRPVGYQNKDRYGRLLRYVHDFGRDAGRASIWRGYAQNYDAFSHPRESSYKAAERAAKKANRGLWKTCWYSCKRR
jgi:endonuclease YncB( thermonuclease family)